MFAASASPVAVVSFVHNQGSQRAVYGFEGVPQETASATLYAPLFRAKQLLNPANPNSGRLDTGIVIVNPGSTPVSVAVTYHGAGGSCAGQTITTQPTTVGAGSNHVFWQGDPAGQGLPANCYGSAVIRATGGAILGIVNDALNGNQTAAAYNAFTAEQTALSVAVPLFRRGHLGRYFTGVSVMNAGAVDAVIAIRISLTLPDGSSAPVNCGVACSQTVGPNETAIFWPGSMSVIRDGAYGSAVIDSTQPIAVIVNDVDVTGTVDMATYGGIRMPAD